jgi:hypothetical protein
MMSFLLFISGRLNVPQNIEASGHCSCHIGRLLLFAKWGIKDPCLFTAMCNPLSFLACELPSLLLVFVFPREEKEASHASVSPETLQVKYRSCLREIGNLGRKWGVSLEAWTLICGEKTTVYVVQGVFWWGGLTGTNQTLRKKSPLALSMRG